MTEPSNLYAEKIFAEQPIALWALDDAVDFVSLIDNNDKALSGWTISGNASFSGVVTQSPQVSSSPILGLVIEDDLEVSVSSDIILNSDNLDQSKSSFNISTYIKADSEATIKLGYVIDSTPVYETFSYSPQENEGWAFVSKTFPLPAANKNISLFISITQSINLESTFYINNFSFGQWSENNATSSSGVVLEELSSYEDIDLGAGVWAVPANSYGLASSDAYYLASSNKLFAYNDGFPMVYGASNITKILPNTDKPSLIIPGNRLLNDAGKYIDTTAEMWIRISPSSNEATRFFGPLLSSDGIYTHGEFITIKVGSSYGSHFIGEWGRPMLLHFRVSENTASLLIDGEQVISISTDTESLDLPKPYSALGKSQDWLGFYSYAHIDVFDIDCVAVYGYQIPEVVAKRRFIYGQGVEFPELSSSALIGASTFIDYKVADYANNYIYPDMGRWSQGITDNVVIQNGVLKTPTYSLPTVVFNNRNMTYKKWLTLSSQYLEDSYGSVDFSLADSVAGSGGYIYFDNLNITSSQASSIYGVFKTTSTTDQILFKLTNSNNNSTFTVALSGTKITYTLSDGSADDILIESENDISLGQVFVAGINIKQLSAKYGGRISRFFGSSKNVSVYVGGQSDFADTFVGRIYRFGLSSARNSYAISQYFENDGGILATVDVTDAVKILNYTATYTLKPNLYIDNFILDIAVNSYWQDYVPLSYLAGSALNAEGGFDKSLDFIQFNISNPALKVISDSSFDTSASQTKTYITFQYMQSKPNVDHNKFLYTESLPESGVIYPGASWLLTKYEVLDDTIIYLPYDVNYKSLAIVMHIEITAQHSTLGQVKVRSLQLASQSISNVEPTGIPTRFGDSLFAYTLRGIYPDYSSRNPLSIYKGSTPYLYLTSNSGIKMKDITYSGVAPRVIRSVVNKQRSDLYRVGAVQILGRYYEDTFPTTPTKLVTFTAQNKTVSLYTQSANDTNTRGRVYALNDKTGLPDPTIYFYLNGKLVKDLYITPKTWDMYGIQFQDALDFNSALGYIDISGPLLVHGMSNYRLTSSQDSATAILRSWSQVRTMIGNDITYWGDFLSSDPVITWENILYIPTLKTYLVDPRVPFALYTGTNKIIVGDNTRLRFNKYSYKVYNDIVWQSDILDAV
jgi:hypothetical protein